MHKKVIMLVDNRIEDDPEIDPSKSKFRGSGFNGTEMDSHQIPDFCNHFSDQQSFLLHLHERIDALEKRIGELDGVERSNKIRRRLRRKAKQIKKEFQCPNQQCLKLYGSETSLKNHIKLKHSGNSQKGNN